jgi:hypothetical protein
MGTLFAVDNNELGGEVVMDEPAISVRPSTSLASDLDAQLSSVMVRVDVPEKLDRDPVDVCCIVDISGSMSDMAEYDDDSGVKTNDGLSILDIVKHAVLTVAHTIGSHDRLCIVAFDDTAEMVLPLTEMTSGGLDKVNTTLQKLHPRGSTNIWAGVKSAMDELGAHNHVLPRGKVAMLLTDGQPNVLPPRGHIPELQSYMDKHPGFTFQLNTFGFGYNLDSQLLLDFAVEADGTFAFIPDGLIVGTTFVNSIANVLATTVQNAKLHLMPVGGAQLVGPVGGNYKLTNQSWGPVVSLGPLQGGQSRDIVVPMQIPAGSAPYLEVVLEYLESNGTKVKRTHLGSDRAYSHHAVVASMRCKAVDVAFDAMKQTTVNGVEDAQRNMSELSKTINNQLDAADEDSDGFELLQAIKYDVEGRMSKALRGKSRFDRWGKHYLRALMRAHQLELCTNFMDPGLQLYGGELFKTLRTNGDKVFVALPPPVHTANTVSSMSSYYQGGGGGCFGPSSTVILASANGTSKQIKVSEVKKGDRLHVSGGGTAVVECVAQIARLLDKPLVQLPNGPSITPGHPVRMSGVWHRPRDLAPDALIPHDGAVYNFVLDQNHVVLVDGVECVTWGHGQSGHIVAHPFFGTDSIVNQLQSSVGWQQGYVVVDGFFHDSEGKAIGLKTGMTM